MHKPVLYPGEGNADWKSDFVAAVSHEFRTALTTLRQYNEMLLEERQAFRSGAT
ncbi:MAG: histidine kinase dimerization/phospho-acceptor domain-containing protein [Bryobacteraceae bacterium]